MKLTALSLLAASASAFTVLPQVTTTKNTALFYFGDAARFDLIGNQKDQILAERTGPAILQGGSEVGWTQSKDECGAEDPSCLYTIEPTFDVMDKHGALVNSEDISVAKVQGGSENDWQQPGGAPAPYYQSSLSASAEQYFPPAQAAAPSGGDTGNSGTGGYLGNL